MVRPMRANAFLLDEFAFVQREVLPLFVVLTFLLPVYRTTSRIVSEKRTGVR